MILLARIACVLFVTSAANSIAICADNPDVVAQDLKNLRVPGRVQAALWTRRSDFYTLQVVLDVRPVISVLEDGTLAGGKRPELPDIQVWLLRADGTLIMPRRIELPNSTSITMRATAIDATYSYPLSAATEAIAVAMRVDGAFYINKLESFQE